MIDTGTQDRFIDRMRADGEYPTPAMVIDDTDCRHGHPACRFAGRAHAKSACVHEDAPQIESASPTEQLGLFGVVP